MIHPDTPLAGEAEQLPRHTTPTWEVELLISGAAVFAMLQLPGWLSEHLLPLMPRFVEDLGLALFLIYAYLTSAAVILAITFALHLVLRAQWIALVGIGSVFPDGVRWAGLRMGRILRDTLQRHDRGASACIERADNRATVVFAFGVMMGMTMLWLSLASALAFVACLLISMITQQTIDALYVFAGIVMLVLLPMATATLLDFMIGRRLRPGGFPHRLLVRVFSVYSRVGIMPGFSTSRVLESHLGSRRFQWLTIAVILPVILAVALGFSTFNNSARFGNYAWFPHFGSASRHVLATAHYDDQRDVMHDPAVAYIQSEIVAGPYLKLIMPYSPERDSAALRRHCPAADLVHTDDARASAMLDCLSALHPVSLDGKPLAALHYDVASDPRTRRPALQAMIDVRALAPGRHELRVTRAPPPAGSHDHGKSRVWIIPFWH